MSKALRDAQVEKELSLLNKIIEQRETIYELRNALKEVVAWTDGDASRDQMLMAVDDALMLTHGEYNDRQPTQQAPL